MRKKAEESVTGGDLRCLCGSLVAKVTKIGIELKCRRCKRVALIPLLEKEQRRLEETHPEVFRYRITFDHPPRDEEASSLGDSGTETGMKILILDR